MSGKLQRVSKRYKPMITGGILVITLLSDCLKNIAGKCFFLKKKPCKSRWLAKKCCHLGCEHSIMHCKLICTNPVPHTIWVGCMVGCRSWARSVALGLAGWLSGRAVCGWRAWQTWDRTQLRACRHTGPLATDVGVCVWGTLWNVVAKVRTPTVHTRIHTQR